MTGAGRREGAGARGLPTGDSEAGGAAPTGGQAAALGPPRQPCKSACRAARGVAVVCGIFKLYFLKLFPSMYVEQQRAQLDEEVELLQEKLREKSDGLNELVIKKELADRQVLIQEEEIKHLEEMNANTRRKVIQLQEELEKQRKTVKELQQDKEALQEQQMSNLLLVSTLQSKLDEGKCPVPPVDSRPKGPEVQLEAVQRALLQRESEILDLKEQLEKIKDDLVSKNEEVLHLTLKLDMQNNHSAVSVRELQEENASLKVNDKDPP
ncbi:hypothetical protein HPG69_009148 [Diceros bicornis minor]|uniref:Uncharacterized protein n=1 Tax=Diceros bicornis minor TaxID=77932 RepID=A0A7J7F0K3_DICBM|nr:hypothetical protein HPG69_009148 [Diceros bicornis minor]